MREFEKLIGKDIEGLDDYVVTLAASVDDYNIVNGLRSIKDLLKPHGFEFEETGD
jgi:hypothetical protein